MKAMPARLQTATLRLKPPEPKAPSACWALAKKARPRSIARWAARLMNSTAVCSGSAGVSAADGRAPSHVAAPQAPSCRARKRRRVVLARRPSSAAACRWLAVVIESHTPRLGACLLFSAPVFLDRFGQRLEVILD